MLSKKSLKVDIHVSKEQSGTIFSLYYFGISKSFDLPQVLTDSISSKASFGVI